MSTDRQFGGAFVHGLRSRTPLVLAVALLAVALTLLGLQWLVSSHSFTVIPESVMLRIPNDDYVHASYRVAQLDKHPPTGPAIYLFGGSGTIELMHSETSLADAVGGAAGRPVQVISLATHNQSFAQTLALVDNLPRGSGLLAVGVSPNRFTTSPSDDLGLLAGRTLALTSPALERLMQPYDTRHEGLPGVLPGVLSFATSYLRQRATFSDPWLTPLDYSHHYISDSYRPSMSLRFAGSRQELARELPLYDANVLYNEAALRAVVALGRAKGYAVALFEQPLAPEADGPGWGAYLARYEGDVRATAALLGVPYVRVERSARLSASDFGDLFHLNGAGRTKWTAPFSRRLAALVPY